MGGVHGVAAPHDTDSDFGERGVDNVGVVTGAGNEGVDQHRHAAAHAHVLAELGPRAGEAGADRVGMKDVAGVGHHLGVLASKPHELGVDGERGKSDTRSHLVEGCHKLSLLIGGR